MVPVNKRFLVLSLLALILNINASGGGSEGLSIFTDIGSASIKFIISVGSPIIQDIISLPGCIGSNIEDPSVIKCVKDLGCDIDLFKERIFAAATNVIVDEVTNLPIVKPNEKKNNGTVISSILISPYYLQGSNSYTKPGFKSENRKSILYNVVRTAVCSPLSIEYPNLIIINSIIFIIYFIY